MDKYMLCDLMWIYDLERSKLSVFIKNSSNDRVKNIMTGEIFSIPRRRGDYGTETVLDFNTILNTKGYLQYGFRQMYQFAGTSAFTTLSKEAKQVQKEIKKINKTPYYYDYSPYDTPDIDMYQYMEDSDIINATKRLESLLQQDAEVKRREQQYKNNSGYNF